MTDRFNDACCGVCACNATGIGYAPPAQLLGSWRPLWLCDDLECIPIARNTYAMRQHDFDRLEQLATDDAGHALEAFCEEIGKSDFADFTQSEFEESMRRVIGTYREALKVKLATEAPF